MKWQVKAEESAEDPLHRLLELATAAAVGDDSSQGAARADVVAAAPPSSITLRSPEKTQQTALQPRQPVPDARTGPSALQVRAQHTGAVPVKEAATLLQKMLPGSGPAQCGASSAGPGSLEAAGGALATACSRHSSTTSSSTSSARGALPASHLEGLVAHLLQQPTANLRAQQHQGPPPPQARQGPLQHHYHQQQQRGMALHLSAAQRVPDASTALLAALGKLSAHVGQPAKTSNTSSHMRDNNAHPIAVFAAAALAHSAAAAAGAAHASSLSATAARARPAGVPGGLLAPKHMHLQQQHAGSALQAQMRHFYDQQQRASSRLPPPQQRHEAPTAPGPPPGSSPVRRVQVPSQFGGSTYVVDLSSLAATPDGASALQALTRLGLLPKQLPGGAQLALQALVPPGAHQLRSTAHQHHQQQQPARQQPARQQPAAVHAFAPGGAVGARHGRPPETRVQGDGRESWPLKSSDSVAGVAQEVQPASAAVMQAAADSAQEAATAGGCKRSSVSRAAVIMVHADDVDSMPSVPRAYEAALYCLGSKRPAGAPLDGAAAADAQEPRTKRAAMHKCVATT